MDLLHCVDTDGRMFFTVTRDGRPLRKRRYMFSESFYVVGMAEYGAAFDDKDALDKAAVCFELMLKLYRHPEVSGMQRRRICALLTITIGTAAARSLRVEAYDFGVIL